MQLFSAECKESKKLHLLLGVDLVHARRRERRASNRHIPTGLWGREMIAKSYSDARREEGAYSASRISERFILVLVSAEQELIVTTHTDHRNVMRVCIYKLSGGASREMSSADRAACASLAIGIATTVCSALHRTGVGLSPCSTSPSRGLPCIYCPTETKAVWCLRPHTTPNHQRRTLTLTWLRRARPAQPFKRRSSVCC